jgi:hypothetical protein
MVTTATKPQFFPQTSAVAPAPALPAAPREVLPAPSNSPRLDCPRCRRRLVVAYDEPQCLQCGYQQYDYVSPRNGRSRSILSTATKYVLRYIGDSHTLSPMLAYVKVERLRNRVIYKVKCPFTNCQKIMEQFSLSGKRPVVQEQRYKCNDGHRISLIPGKNGMFGWK